MDRELLLGLLHPDWHQLARCLGQADLMYSEHVGRAKALCRKCRVRDLCLAAALERNEPEGIWGGFTSNERRLILAGLEKGEPLFKIVQSLRSSRKTA